MSKVVPNTSAVLKEAESRAADMLDAFGETMVNATKGNPETPRDVPYMVNTIDYELKGLVVQIFTRCNYGGWVHEGYFQKKAWGRPMKNPRQVEGRPFFKWAFDIAKDSFKG